MAAGMTPALLRVANYVLNDPSTVLYQSITELAEESKSSEASVMRFCRELDYPGFQNFKLALAQELAAHPTMGSTASDDPIVNLIETAKQALNETERLLDRKALEKAARQVLTAKHIEIFGVAASAITAQYLEYKLVRLGLRARALSDAHLATMIAETTDAATLHILVSSSGSTMDPVRVAKIAQGRGATVVTITNRAKSPLVAASDFVLVASWPETPLTGGAFPSKISQLLLVDALAAYATKLSPKLLETIKTTASSVSDRSY